MRILFLSIIIIVSNNSISQIGQSIINYNNCSAVVTDAGLLFNNPIFSSAGYEFPKGATTHIIYSSSFMFGATDTNGDTLLSTTTYLGDTELFEGPHSNNGSYPAATSIWSVAKSDVDYHNANYTQSGYIAATRILAWPGNGNVSFGQNTNLAPFIDLNGNNIYEPLLGDYPDIRGDYATYIIMNDAEKTHANAGTPPLQIEVHLMLYQYISNDYLDSTTFINMRVYNYSSNNYINFITSMFLDADIGNLYDDYAGCDSTKNLVFGYNGDAFDESNGGFTGYGITPAALGVLSLSHNLSSFLSYSGTGPYPYNIPNSKSGFWNAMHGKWNDGASLFKGGNGIVGSTGVTTTPTNFHYHGNPNSPAEWSEVSAVNPPGDRRAIFSVEEVNLPAGGSQCYDFAIIANMQSDNLTNVQHIYTMADQVQTFFNSQTFNCNQVTVSVDEKKLSNFQVYPNPIDGVINIQNRLTSNETKVIIADLSGRIIYENKFAPKPLLTLNFNQKPGTYLITITSGNLSETKTVVVK